MDERPLVIRFALRAAGVEITATDEGDDGEDRRRRGRHEEEFHFIAADDAGDRFRPRRCREYSGGAARRFAVLLSLSGIGRSASSDSNHVRCPTFAPCGDA
jgi:hypothetical protein